MFSGLFATVTGMNFYYKMKPFSIGLPFTLVKEPENEYDKEAIAVHFPVFGKVGYIANSYKTVVNGCMSAGRLYDKIPDSCAAVVRFITDSEVIVEVLPTKKIKIKVEYDFVDVEDHETSESSNERKSNSSRI